MIMVAWFLNKQQRKKQSPQDRGVSVATYYTSVQIFYLQQNSFSF